MGTIAYWERKVKDLEADNARLTAERDKAVAMQKDLAVQRQIANVRANDAEAERDLLRGANEQLVRIAIRRGSPRSEWEQYREALARTDLLHDPGPNGGDGLAQPDTEHE